MDNPSTVAPNSRWRAWRESKNKAIYARWNVVLIAFLCVTGWVLWYALSGSAELDRDARAVLAAQGIEQPTTAEVTSMRHEISAMSVRTGRASTEVARDLAEIARAMRNPRR